MPVAALWIVIGLAACASHLHFDRSGWQRNRNLNNISIGIEIVNAGWVDGPNGRTWAPFPAHQIDTLIALTRDIMKRHGIAPKNVLGHGDVAPQRKQDPGALFPRKRLTEENGAIPGNARNTRRVCRTYPGSSANWPQWARRAAGWTPDRETLS